MKELAVRHVERRIKKYHWGTFVTALILFEFFILVVAYTWIINTGEIISTSILAFVLSCFLIYLLPKDSEICYYEDVIEHEKVNERNK
jgi:hypothetical protein